MGAENSTSIEDKVDEAIEALEDNFDYVVDGFKALARQGYDPSDIINTLDEHVIGIMNDIADTMSE